MKLSMVCLVLLCAAPLSAAKDSCLTCHSALEGDLQAPAKAYSEDIHSLHGFTCADCHGGNPEADDPEAAMSAARGFRGKVARTAIPQMCARCHSDANFMHRYAPQQRVDQLELYKTSVHGKLLATGDTAVATCIDCHSVHDIREVKNGLSPVHPLRLPETCARCHADAKHMAKYKIETNQFAEYRQSVHWEALSKRGDLSAPNCVSCHGNHGATPPQVSSVAAVCGTCHVQMETLFRSSPHDAAFASMGLSGCIVCHDKHAIHRATTDMISGPQAVCTPCHESDSKGGVAAAEMGRKLRELQAALDQSDQVLTRAQESGMEVSDALLRQMEGRDRLVKARVAVHAFSVSALDVPVKEGLAIAAETKKSGLSALQERDQRRTGLAISLVTILITMIGLGLAIRALENRSAVPSGPQGSGT
jgi:Cytochrome c3